MAVEEDLAGRCVFVGTAPALHYNRGQYSVYNTYDHMPYSQSFSAFSNSSLRNFDIALYSLYYSSMEYALQPNCEIVTSVALNSACKQALQQLRARTFGAYVLELWARFNP